MKIKQRNIGILICASIGAVVYLYALVHGIASEPNYFADFSAKAYIANAIYILAILLLFVGTLFGSYVKIEDEKIVRAEGYLKKYFLLKNITKIYCAPHVFLGPSMFLEYSGKEKKLLVLNLYRSRNEKELLDFLKQNYPNIQQDKYCEKIRNGEKILSFQ